MKSTQFIRKQAQAGFTLIELIVVIVILGILAATALPRMFDMSGQARLAKMQAALGAVKAASATAHAAWLMNGGLLECSACPSPVTKDQASVKAEGQQVIMLGGYPDVGNAGIVQGTASATVAGGIFTASNLAEGDYALSTNAANTAATPTTNSFTVAADAAHPKCSFTYTEAVQTVGTATVPSTVTTPAVIVPQMSLDNCS